MADIRAADVDRERVVQVLQQHVVAGRLSLDEFSDRAASAWAAKTLNQLRELTADLPRILPPVVPAPREPWWRTRSAAAVLQVVALVMLAVALLTLASVASVHAQDQMMNHMGPAVAGLHHDPGGFGLGAPGLGQGAPGPGPGPG